MNRTESRPQGRNVTRYQAQLPLRRSYRPARRLLVPHTAPGLAVRATPRALVLSPACAPEGAWNVTRTG